MKIQNTQVKVPENSNLNEKDLLNYLLTTFKELSKNYTIALTEFSNDNLFNTFNVDLQNILVMQRDTFKLMFNYGWYTLETVNESKEKTTYQTVNKEYKTLSK